MTLGNRDCLDAGGIAAVDDGRVVCIMGVPRTR